jgi:hypothetical protein
MTRYKVITLLDNLSPRIKSVYNYSNILSVCLNKYQSTKKPTTTKIVNAFYSRMANGYINLDTYDAKKFDELI